MPELNPWPTCDRADCACCEGGHCALLTRNDFNKDCPFFKTREQVAEEQEYCRNRLAMKNEEDYINA